MQDTPALQFHSTVVNTPPNPNPPSERLSVLARLLAGEPRSILGLVCAIASLFPEPVPPTWTAPTFEIVSRTALAQAASQRQTERLQALQLTFTTITGKPIAAPLHDHCKHGMTAAWCQTCIEANNLDYLALKFREVQTRFVDRERKADRGYRKTSAQELEQWSWLKKSTTAMQELPVEAKASVWEPNRKELNEHFDDFAFSKECCTLRHELQADEPLFASSDLAKSYALRLATVQRVTLRGWDLRPDGLGRFANWCEECRVCYGREHSCRESRLYRQIAADRLAAKREETRKRLLAELAAYQSDGYDREILVSRGSVANEAVRKFDRDLSRKGNKWRAK